jgi:glycerol-3-phosphate cytidylyltransferase-like family protein
MNNIIVVSDNVDKRNKDIPVFYEQSKQEFFKLMVKAYHVYHELAKPTIDISTSIIVDYIYIGQQIYHRNVGDCVCSDESS